MLRNMMYPVDTIVAIATAPGAGPVGIVRLSGPRALAVLGKIWVGNNINVDNFLSTCIYYGNIVNLSTGAVENFVDEVLVAYFQSPKSYTGEDVVEILAHGSPYILEQVVT